MRLYNKVTAKKTPIASEPAAKQCPYLSLYKSVGKIFKEISKSKPCVHEEHRDLQETISWSGAPQPDSQLNFLFCNTTFSVAEVEFPTHLLSGCCSPMGRMVPPPAELLILCCTRDGPCAAPQHGEGHGIQGVPLLGTDTAPTTALVAPSVTLSSSDR